MELPAAEDPLEPRKQRLNAAEGALNLPFVDQ